MNRELDDKFQGLHDKLGDQDKVLAKILEQALKTNGRVSLLEKIVYSLLVGLAVYISMRTPEFLGVILKLL